MSRQETDGTRERPGVTRGWGRWAVLFVTSLTLSLALSESSAASGPDLTVPSAKLKAALVCPIEPAGADNTPILLVTGTGSDGPTVYGFTQGAFEAYGHPVCHVTFPEFATGDLQVSVQYLVDAVRRMHRIADRKVAIVGISQGGLLPRFALSYWPGLRRKVSDLIAVAAPQHGAPLRLQLGDIVVSEGCSPTAPCKPAIWQQERGSSLLDALSARPDETPGRVSYTTVRSLTDETVRPTSGSRATASLDGARNILIQDVCPGRETTHIGSLVDSVTFAALFDAVEAQGAGKKGAAKPSRLPADVCDQSYAPGLDEALTTAGIQIGPVLSATQMTSAPKATSEPKVWRVFRDTRVRATATAKRTQIVSGNRVRVEVKVKAKDDLTARAKGKVTLQGRTYKLERKRRRLDAGQTRVLTLRPERRREELRIAKALRRGEIARASVNVKLTGQLGNSKTVSKPVRLKSISKKTPVAG